jgi:hypothetical protein
MRQISQARCRSSTNVSPLHAQRASIEARLLCCSCLPRASLWTTLYLCDNVVFTTPGLDYALSVSARNARTNSKCLPEQREEDERGAEGKGTFDPTLNYDDELQKLEKGSCRFPRSNVALYSLRFVRMKTDACVRTSCLSTTDFLTRKFRSVHFFRQ